jgi:hypothetical protein
MKIESSRVIFSTGTEKYAYRGVIGLGPDGVITEGYDGDFHHPSEEWMDDEDYDGLTLDEQIELADYTIEQWQKVKADIECP